LIELVADCVVFIGLLDVLLSFLVFPARVFWAGSIC
jgi:hypothetical protein